MTSHPAHDTLVVDSHCHLNYLDDPLERLAAARALGVAGVLCIGVDQAGSEAVIALADSQPDLWATAGAHPDSVVPLAELDTWLPGLCAAEAVVGVGETGLDYYRDPSAAQRQLQRDSFDYHLALAERQNLPVVVHTRAAVDDTLAALRSCPQVRGVLHCFTEDWTMAEQALALGWYVSMSGIVTFRNAKTVQDVARRIPDDRLLVETDAPWLAPVPHRGHTNEPAWVVDTAKFVAELRGQTFEHVAAITSANFEALFGVRLADQPAAGNSSSNSR